MFSNCDYAKVDVCFIRIYTYTNVYVNAVKDSLKGLGQGDATFMVGHFYV